MRDLHLPGRSPVYATNGMAATSNPLSSKVAIQMLEAGGNAVDAAIAAAVLQGLIEPAMTGIGGDCFVLLTPPGSDKTIALNGSGRAPSGFDSDALRAAGHKTIPHYSIHTVTIPGAIDAFCRLSADYGKLGLKAALAPAIHNMRAGVPVSPRNVFDWAMHVDDLQGDAREHYLFDGKAPRVGQIFRAPKQADVLEHIADKGRAGFYEGEVMEDMVASLQALGGSHTAEDFTKTECTYSDPIMGIYGDYELLEHPPNGQGATAILMANMMKKFDIASMDPWGAERAHIEAEIAKLAYDARNRFLAEETARLDHMLAQETADKLASLIDPKKAMAAPSELSESVHKETICLSVVDKDQMCVSMIYSVFHSFGSGLASKKFGINFQSRGAGFTLEKGHPNEAAGGKRPMHTIIPGLLRQGGKPVMPFGVMGGAYQPNGHARFISNLADYGLDPQCAMDGPRSFSDAGIMNVERGYSDAVRTELAEMGHKVDVPKVPIGGAQAVMIDYENGCLVGASDHRKDGAALGY
ncbi:MAG: gamma-glutamyltransferase family protein [Pseudomonadota bacterium]